MIKYALEKVATSTGPSTEQCLIGTLLTFQFYWLVKKLKGNVSKACYTGF